MRKLGASLCLPIVLTPPPLKEHFVFEPELAMSKYHPHVTLFTTAS